MAECSTHDSYREVLLPLDCRLLSPHATLANQVLTCLLAFLLFYKSKVHYSCTQALASLIQFPDAAHYFSSSGYPQALIMGDTITAQNTSSFLINPQIEPVDANISDERLPQNGFSLRQRLTCISWDDDNEAASFTAPCKHSYCDDCLVSYVKSSLEPGGVFPPVCCNLPITLQSARSHLHHDLIKRYQDKHSAILASCSLLCAQSGCCVIIPPERIVNGLGHCSAYNNHTCIKCRQQEHKQEPCPTDEKQRDLTELAKKQGWQTCYRCNNMIELNFGCNHMT